MEDFHDIIRTERYYTATLLPAVLLHDNFAGLGQFLSRIEANASDTAHLLSVTGPGGLLGKMAVPTQIELVTEFHIARDISRAKQLSGIVPAHAPPFFAEDTESSRRDAPDIVIRVGSLLVVCEGKFFSRPSWRGLKRQLSSQRKQIELLFDIFPSLTGFVHVALVPELPRLEAGERTPWDAAVTWKEISQLSADVLGSTHYVTLRFKAALMSYAREFGRGGAYFQDLMSLHDVLGLCKSRGRNIQVGVVGGISVLRGHDRAWANARRWKWRDVSNTGRINPKNWIPGDEFVRQIAALGS
ncbi:MAG: hypothetical protein EXR52_02510 [Dehalococcoidia bacterium]|nr:hypothetical protein [Dehalococcoidia bacterium]